MPRAFVTSRFNKGDLSGGLSSAVLAIGGNVAAGVIAFSPLGQDYLGEAVLAGMLSSIVAGLLASLSGSAPGMIVGPQATTAMAFAALLSQLLATGHFDGRPELLLSLAFSAVMISGSVQILLGAFRVGGLVKFMPYPVVAGIQNTTAILLIAGQFWTFLGVEPELGAGAARFMETLGRTQPATVLVSLITVLVAWKGARFLPKAAVPVAALGVGTVSYYLFKLLMPGVGLGQQLPQIEATLPGPDYLTSILSGLGEAATLGVLATVIAGAVAMAILDSVASLITLVSYQGIAGRRFAANSQLVGQGIGSAVSALFGGLTAAGSLTRATLNHEAGGRTRGSGVINAVGVLILILVLARPLSWIPKAAIAGLIVVIATSLFDRWVLGQAREALRRDAEDTRDNWIAVGLMVFVVVVGVMEGLVAAVGAGVALSVVVFVVQMSRSPIRRVRTGASVRSARRRARSLTDLLEAHGDRISVIELEGMIFFGSCDSLATRAEALADGGAEFVLLDLRRVHGIDATGYQVLGQIYQRLRRRGSTVAFSHVVPGRLNKEIAEDLKLNGVPNARMFESVDRALEYFEEALLTKLGADALRISAWAVADFGKAWGLTGDECAVLERYVDRRVFEAGDVVFMEGDVDRSMFLISRGTADVTIPIGDGRRSRLATFQQGTVFGEMALLDGEPRAARIEATAPLEVFELTHEAFDRLHTEEHAAAMKIQTAVGRVLGRRLRGANELILELDS
jgi:sulfate permease, SulP family